jgi:hypothetical protein
MAKSVVYLDDLNGDAGAETVAFAIDGTSYEVDLADANSTRLRMLLAEFVAVARVVEKNPGQGARNSRKAGGPGAYGFHPATVREWWKDNEEEAGRPFAQKGVVPRRIVEKWDAAGRPGEKR